MNEVVLYVNLFYLKLIISQLLIQPTISLLLIYVL